MLAIALAILEATHVRGDNPLAYTCAPGQPGASLPFCDRGLGFEARAADLGARLNISEHIDLFFSYPSSPSIARLNTKGWSLDRTCIHGVNKESNVTVFPHAIAQGASWDLQLVTRVSNATAAEARILSQMIYIRTNGQNAGAALSCDGGPLANSAHDPRWGRISETYGEDPTLIQTVGVRVMQALQNPQPVPGGHPSDRFLATRQVTRHYIAYHGGSGDRINGTSYNALYNATNRSLADSYLPTYGAFQRPDAGAADGIMCAMTELNGVPSCADPFLMTTMLREAWSSDAIIQTDCCDSIRTMAQFGYENLTDSEALALAVNDGLGVYFGFAVTEFREAMAANLKDGNISEATVRAAGTRVLLTQMKLGFFDYQAPDFPFANASIPWEYLDGPAHRQLAREAAAKSTVLLKNDGILPLRADSGRPYPRVAVVGPFAECESYDGRNPNGTCYLHSYNSIPSAITTIRDGVEMVLSSAGGKKDSFVYERGCNATCGWKCGPSGEPCWGAGGPAQPAIDAAVAASRAADLTILVLGTGALVEGEGCDRFNLTLPGVQQALQQAVTAVAKKLIIVVVSAGGVDMDESGANAILWAPYGGEEAGSGVADVLFGHVTPSAKLPLTWNTQAWFHAMDANETTSLLNLNLEVGAGRTHRYLKNENFIKHRFGFGLSYTNFTYTDLRVTVRADQSLAVTVHLSNTGPYAGAEVVQVYLRPENVASDGASVMPVQNLVAFTKVELQPNDSAEVAVFVPVDAMKTAMDDGTRMLLPGAYGVWVGGHQPDDKEGEATSGPSLRYPLTIQ